MRGVDCRAVQGHVDDSGKIMAVSSAWYEESVLMCKLRQSQVEGLGAFTSQANQVRDERDTNCVPKRVWKAEPVFMETSLKG